MKQSSYYMVDRGKPHVFRRYGQWTFFSTQNPKASNSATSKWCGVLNSKAKEVTGYGPFN